MSRITITIGSPIMKAIRSLAVNEGKKLTEIINQLLQTGLSARRSRPEKRPFQWKTQKMGARVSLTDGEALYKILDELPHS